MHPSHAEDVRVKIRGTVEPGGAEAAISYADGVRVDLPDDLEFVDGIELELRVPKAAQGFKGAFLIMFYKRVAPAPSASALSYSAVRAASLVVPAKVSQAFRIPLRPAHGFRPSPYAVDLGEIRKEDFPLIVRLMPAIKGLPEELERAEFTVKAKPILRDEGKLSLSLEWGAGLDPGSPIAVTVDDRPVEDHRKPIPLKSGDHALRITGSDVRDEFIAFRLERGQRLELKAVLEDVVPRLVLDFPERTKVELDGKRLDAAPGAELPVTPGEHSLSFTVGDYSIQRKLLVKRAKTYRVSLLVDLRVEESD